jgi:hypothetical protein
MRMLLKALGATEVGSETIRTKGSSSSTKRRSPIHPELRVLIPILAVALSEPTRAVSFAVE